MCKLKLDNDGIIDVYGYDEVADYLYQNSCEYLHAEGRIDTNMMVEILEINGVDSYNFIFKEN